MSKEMREKIDRFKNWKQFLNENIYGDIWYHITPDVNLPSIRISGIKMSNDGTNGIGVYLSDSIKEALKWKDILEYENYEENNARGVKEWFIIEIHNLNKKKLDKEDVFEDDELYFTEYVYRDNIGLDKIKSIKKI